MTLANPDSNGIKRYTETTAITTFSAFLNLALAEISAWITNRDTGWQTLTLINTATVSGGKTPAYKVRDGICYLRGELNANTGSNAKFTLPAGARPTMEISVLLRAGSGATGVGFRLETDGDGICAASSVVDLAGVPPFPVS